MKMESETITNTERFTYYIEINEENEILSASQITHHCSECGEAAIISENLDEPAYCEEHPSAMIDSVHSDVALVNTPTGIGEDADTDVVFFTPDSTGLAGSFGLQVRREDGGLKSISDLDGDVLSFNATWIVPDKVPVPIAQYAKAVCW